MAMVFIYCFLHRRTSDGLVKIIFLGDTDNMLLGRMKSISLSNTRKSDAAGFSTSSDLGTYLPNPQSNPLDTTLSPPSPSPCHSPSLCAKNIYNQLFTPPEATPLPFISVLNTQCIPPIPASPWQSHWSKFAA